jgi:hypothetical protein
MDRRVSSMYLPWLNEGMTIEIFGHVAGGVDGVGAAASVVHGQPVRPAGGEGSSLGDALLRPSSWISRALMVVPGVDVFMPQSGIGPVGRKQLARKI